MKSIRKALVRTVIPVTVLFCMLTVSIAANILLPRYDGIISGFLKDPGGVSAILPEEYKTMDLQYNKLDCSSAELQDAERALNEEIVAEGIVLLKNDNDLLPLAKGTPVSFFGHGSQLLVGNPWYAMMQSMGVPADPGMTLKTAFSDAGFPVNETLWNFYAEGKGSEYKMGAGSLSFGDSEDFSINECPLGVLEQEAGLLQSAAMTVPVFVWSRRVGEGRDMPRSMYLHADNDADRAKSYLQPDSAELELLSYLNDHFENVILLVNSSAAMELGWVKDFEHIRSVLYLPSAGQYGLHALADVISGEITPSGKTTDTFAFDAASAPAAANYGDFRYTDEQGALTKYAYLEYAEGIYVGYRYYETRYEDRILQQGNAGSYDYASEVLYPFGYGLSYTTFARSDLRTSLTEDRILVTVTVENTGSRPGKDVVEVYAQTPYTDYDRKNLVEKSAVQLVGWEKTPLLEPGARAEVTVSVDRALLKSYDRMGAKAYILDAGDYLITAAGDAHEAINNILAAKGYGPDDGMTAEGRPEMTFRWTEAELRSFPLQPETGAEVTNRFDFMDVGTACLSRQDWLGTMPVPDGEVSGFISQWSNEINTADGKSCTYVKKIDPETLAKLDSADSRSPVSPESFTDRPVYGAMNGLDLIGMRGRDYDDPAWELLLDQLKEQDYEAVITRSGYGTIRLDSVGKPFALDQDASTGLTGGGTGVSYCGAIVLAQTWNRDLARRYGEMIGRQALSGGCTGWYAPAMNIHRLPFSGRNNEYYSEDPILSGYTAAAAARGASSMGMYTFIKHFVLNDQENHRGDREGNFGVATFSNEQALREIYLKPFELCILQEPITLSYITIDEQGVYGQAERPFPAVNAVMTAFNRLGCTWTGGCYELITGVLREEWGFNGFVITDNANTGLYMDAMQMLEAGGDAKLTNEPSAARWTFDSSDPVQYHYAREALHHILYTTANSKLMNGLIPGAEYVTHRSGAEKLLLAVNVVTAAVSLGMIALLAAGAVRSRRERAKETTAEG